MVEGLAPGAGCCWWEGKSKLCHCSERRKARFECVYAKIICSDVYTQELLVLVLLSLISPEQVTIEGKN
jgi:hypothetical protein